VRNGKKAVKYAKTYASYRMDRYEKNKNPKKGKPFGAYEILAQAYAPNGQFAEAEKTMRHFPFALSILLFAEWSQLGERCRS